MRQHKSSDRVEHYVRRHNIERYRQLLQSGELDAKRRRTILSLLEREEAELAAQTPNPNDKGG